jgi:hypothetical protein
MSVFTTAADAGYGIQGGTRSKATAFPPPHHSDRRASLRLLSPTLEEFDGEPDGRLVAAETSRSGRRLCGGIDQHETEDAGDVAAPGRLLARVLHAASGAGLPQIADDFIALPKSAVLCEQQTCRVCPMS